MDSPNIEEAAAARNEINRLSIGRPARLVVPSAWSCDGSPVVHLPRASCREWILRLLSDYCFEDNPSAIRREVWLVDIIGWVGDDLSRRCFRMRGGAHG